MNKQPRILIADDEPFNVDFLTQELEELDYEIMTAVNGEDVLAKVDKAQPDLILLDIMMPVLDGFATLGVLKSTPATRDIPVILISAHTDLARVTRGIEMGAEDYLPKPFDPVLLRARIRNGLEKKRWHDQEKQYLQQIESEKRRADELLHVIFPNAVVEELKATNVVKPRLYQDVAVLFTDIVDFTAYCDTHSPEDVVLNLQLLVHAYERLALNYKMQKIKTIGDAFMAVGGLLQPLANPVMSCVQCGFDMIAAARKVPAQWDVRVGIHVGPVMAGVVGYHQYLFDLWGDTVNTAQRIESCGRDNTVNLSAAAWEQVSSCFLAVTRHVATIKGKGELEICTIHPNGDRGESGVNCF
jgi:DNA-binding response OmpR family regulator